MLNFLRSAAGRWTLALLVLVLAAGGVYVSLTRSARGRFLMATRVTDARGIATRELAATVRRGLARLDVSPDRVTAEAPPRGVDSAWVVRLPPRLPLAEANLAITQVLSALGGTVWDAIELPVDGAAAVRMTLGSPRDPLAQITLVSRNSPVIGAPTQRLALVFLDATAATVRQLEPLLAAHTELAVAVSPRTPGADTLARHLAARGVEVLLDLPMESKLGAPQPGDIRVDMSAHDIDRAVEDALEAVPGATGVVNLDGSLALQDERTTTAVLAALQQRRLYFLEVPTTTDSVCRRVGRQLAATVVTVCNVLDGRYSARHGVQEPLAHVVRDILPASHTAIIAVRGDSLSYHATLAATDSLATQGVSLVPLSTVLE